MLCCFAFTATAGNVLNCIGMSDNTDTQQTPLDKVDKNCHFEQNNTTDESSNDCCQDMTSCQTSLVMIPYSTFKNLQITRQSAQLPLNEQIVINIFAQPTPPPKLIS
jgi:hypothetical protein